MIEIEKGGERTMHPRDIQYPSATTFGQTLGALWKDSDALSGRRLYQAFHSDFGGGLVATQHHHRSLCSGGCIEGSGCTEIAAIRRFGRALALYCLHIACKFQ